MFDRMDLFSKINTKNTGIFAAGVLFGTAGITLLSSRDAKKVYTHGVAAVLRAKECIMKTVTSFQENAEDIYAEARAINEERDAGYAEFADESDETAETADESEYKEVADAEPEAAME